MLFITLSSKISSYQKKKSEISFLAAWVNNICVNSFQCVEEGLFWVFYIYAWVQIKHLKRPLFTNLVIGVAHQYFSNELIVSLLIFSFRSKFPSKHMHPKCNNLGCFFSLHSSYQSKFEYSWVIKWHFNWNYTWVI